MRSDRSKLVSSMLVAWLLLATTLVGAADISPLPDFATSDFSREEAFVRQTGSNNVTSVDQQEDLSGAVGHYSEVTQVGAGNQAYTVQVGDLNRVRIVQNGSYNFASTTQNGLRNSIDLSQTGQDNNLLATQTGNDNGIVLSQPGSALATLTETGNNNTIAIAQDSGGPRLEINLVGNGVSVTAK